VSLERHLDRDPGRHVDERPARPDGRVQRGELVVVLRDDRPEVLLDEVLVLAQPGVHVEEQHALLRQVLLELVVDDLALVLRADAGEELPLRLRDPQPVPRVLDVGRQVLPRLGLLLGRPDVIEDVVEVDPAHVAAPPRQRPALEVVKRLQPELPHPLRLVLVRGDRLDDLLREPAARLEEVVLRVAEPVLVVLTDLGDDLCLRLRLRSHTATSSVSNAPYPSASSLSASSGPPSSTIRPPEKTWTKSGLM